MASNDFAGVCVCIMRRSSRLVVALKAFAVALLWARQQRHNCLILGCCRFLFGPTGMSRSHAEFESLVAVGLPLLAQKTGLVC